MWVGRKEKQDHCRTGGQARPETMLQPRFIRRREEGRSPKAELRALTILFGWTCLRPLRSVAPQAAEGVPPLKERLEFCAQDMERVGESCVIATSEQPQEIEDDDASCSPTGRHHHVTSTRYSNYLVMCLPYSAQGRQGRDGRGGGRGA